MVHCPIGDCSSGKLAAVGAGCAPCLRAAPPAAAGWPSCPACRQSLRHPPWLSAAARRHTRGEAGSRAGGPSVRAVRKGRRQHPTVRLRDASLCGTPNPDSTCDHRGRCGCKAVSSYSGGSSTQPAGSASTHQLRVLGQQHVLQRHPQLLLDGQLQARQAGPVLHLDALQAIPAGTEGRAAGGGSQKLEAGRGEAVAVAAVAARRTRGCQRWGWRAGSGRTWTSTG